MKHLQRVTRLSFSGLFLSLAAVLAFSCGTPVIGGDDDDDVVSPTPTPGDDDDDSSPQLTLVDTYDMPIAADVAANATGDVVAISGWFNEQVLILDTSVKDDVRLHASIDNIGYNGDVQIKGSTLYINHEYESRGIDIYDISDPTSPQLQKMVGPNTGYPTSLESCHNMYPQTDRDLLYCASTSTGEVAILSTGEVGGTPDDPVHLIDLSSPGAGQYGAHDMVAFGNLLYIAWLDSGFAIYDITDPSNPQMLAHKEYAGQFCHNLWPTGDGNYLFSTDEYLGGHLRVWDISDLGNITEVGEYRPNDNSVVHNVEVRGTTAYISHYTEGVKVLDVTNPKAPVELGVYDFYTLPDTGGDNQSGMRGNWGVEPVGDYVFASGMESGLYVLQVK